MYFKYGRVKVNLSLARGREAHDKRERREAERTTRAVIKECRA